MDHLIPSEWKKVYWSFYFHCFIYTNIKIKVDF